MQRRAIACSFMQKAKKRTQNPSEAIPWGFDSPSRHHLRRLISTLYGDIWLVPSVQKIPVRYKYGTGSISFIFIHLGD